jgi:hypothetical protein
MNSTLVSTLLLILLLLSLLPNPSSQEKRHHITAELGYSETWWRKYDFYFAYCEAAFDMRYIHDYHVTWHKSAAAEPAGSLAAAQPAAVAAVVAAAGAGAGWVKQELPTDSFTQVGLALELFCFFLTLPALCWFEAPQTPTRCEVTVATPPPPPCCGAFLLLLLLQALLALYFFLAGLLVQRHPLLWVMPITSTLCALLHGTVALLAHATSRSYRALGPLARAQFCGAVCRLVYSAAVSACALTLVAAAGPWMLLPQPSPLQEPISSAAETLHTALAGHFKAVGAALWGNQGTQALLAAAAAAAAPVQQAVVAAVSALPPAVVDSLSTASQAAAAAVQRGAAQLPQQQLEVLGPDHAWVLLPATLLACVAAGYYAFRLWRLMRGRGADSRGVALLRYTLLLLVYGVASFKGSQVCLLAAALGCEAVGVPAAAGKVLDLLAAGHLAAAAGAGPVRGSVVPRSGGRVRKGLLLLERVLFPLLR